MLESFEKMKWEDIYSYWRISTEDHLNIVNNTPDPITILLIQLQFPFREMVKTGHMRTFG